MVIIVETSEEQTFIQMSIPWYQGTNYNVSEQQIKFKWWSEYQSINQMVIWILNYFGPEHLKGESFDEQTNPCDLKT